MAEGPDNFAAEEAELRAIVSEVAAGLDAARLDVRFVGYCAYCDRLVARAPDGSCPEGHPADAVTGRILLLDDEPVPVLPRFNLAAFALPSIWGPMHGQWVGVVFLPIWLFVDDIVGTVGNGGVLARIAAPIVVVLTLAFQAFFAKRANGLAFRRVCDRVRVSEYVRQERVWAAVCVPVGAAILAWAVWFHIAVAPTLVR